MDALKFELPKLSPQPGRIFIGVSGGLDSVVLLDLLYTNPPLLSLLPHALTILHVHHNLQAEASKWADFVARLAEKYQCAFEMCTLNPQDFVGENVEAIARKGRYAFFASHLTRPDDYLFLAQHRNDQVETFFLNLQRGSGLKGLTAMPFARPMGKGHLVRPLLNHSRAALERYAHDQGLAWIEDPSNQDTALNRNFLRAQILPILRERWPHFDAHVAQAITHLQDTRTLIDDYLNADVLKLGVPLDLTALKSLPEARHMIVLQAWIKHHTGKILSHTQLKIILNEVIHAKRDSRPLFEIPGLVLRREKHTLVFKLD